MFTTNKEFRPPVLSGFNMRISLVMSDHLCHPSKCDLVRVGCMSKSPSSNGLLYEIVFSHGYDFSLIQSQSSYDSEDYEGAQRLGRKALHMGIASFVIGLVIITVFSVVHFTTVLICTNIL